ncbi:hypothetical protein C8R46DRAFT_1193568 [Mycena filopes]|nr:hypothetical protein C8R46DRAFT_1193568 [Mycena filopes]
MSIRSSLSGSHSSGASVHSIANTVTSTTPLTTAYRPPPKDYAAAFANLQASYGMSGDFPARAAPVKKKKKTQAAAGTERAGPSGARRQGAPEAATTRSASTSGPYAPRQPSNPAHRSPLARHPSTSSDAEPAPPPQNFGPPQAPDPASDRDAGEKSGKPSGVTRLRKMLGIRKGTTK